MKEFRGGGGTKMTGSVSKGPVREFKDIFDAFF